MADLDFYDFYSDLSVEEKMIKETAKKFANEPELIAALRECNINETGFPRIYFRKMGALGFFGADLKGYDCAELNSVSYGLLMQELERRDSTLRSTASVQGGLVMHAIYKLGTADQKEKWLPSLRDGEAIGCFGLTESFGGSNPAGMRTRAKLEGNKYIIDGEKTWITNGGIADIGIVFAQTSKGPGGIRGFLVEKETPGFSTTFIRGKGSLRASIVSQLIFENCEIPKENLLPGTEIGLKSVLDCLNPARYGIAWGAIGAAMACYESALLESTENRKPFDEPIAGYQLIQEKLTWMVKEITKAQLLCFQLARLRDKGKVTNEQISLAKWNNVNIALEIAREARAILGADGITYEYPVWTHLANLESVRTYEGTEEIHILNVGRKITGISAIRNIRQ
ncbi:MAG: acyl-CoA dehydrogenase family protein [Patescibacteria group bacterium]